VTRWQGLLERVCGRPRELLGRQAALNCLRGGPATRVVGTLRPHCHRCCCPAATTSRPPSSPSLTAQVRHTAAPGALAAAAQALSAARAWTGGAAEAPRT
jgi:hypothetical protein